jgi:hypothetical protein
MKLKIEERGRVTGKESFVYSLDVVDSIHHKKNEFCQSRALGEL